MTAVKKKKHKIRLEMMKNNFLFKLGNCLYVEGMHTIA